MSPFFSAFSACRPFSASVQPKPEETHPPQRHPRCGIAARRGARPCAPTTARAAPRGAQHREMLDSGPAGLLDKPDSRDGQCLSLREALPV